MPEQEHMQYEEFKVKIGDSYKRGGIIGECHIYTKEESLFVRPIVDAYSMVAAEGSTEHAPFMIAASIIALPAIVAFNALSDRSIEYDSADTYAKKQGKQPVKLEDCSSSLFSSRQKIAFTGLFALGSLMIPYDIGRFLYKKMIERKK